MSFWRPTNAWLYLCTPYFSNQHAQVCPSISRNPAKAQPEGIHYHVCLSRSWLERSRGVSWETERHEKACPGEDVPLVITSCRGGLRYLSESWLWESVQVSLSTRLACNPTTWPSLHIYWKTSLRNSKNSLLTDKIVQMSCVCGRTCVSLWLHLTSHCSCHPLLIHTFRGNVQNARNYTPSLTPSQRMMKNTPSRNITYITHTYNSVHTVKNTCVFICHLI